MKIAILSLYSGHIPRGVENWADMVKKHLPHHRVDIFGADSVNLTFDWSQPTSVDTLARRFFIDYWSRLILLFTLRLLPPLVRGKYDLVIPTNGCWQSFLMRLAGWLFGFKVVIFAHSGIGWDDRVNLWTFPNTFVALSTPGAAWAKRVTPWVPIIHIPIGVDLNIFSPRGPVAKVSLQPPIILSAAAAFPSKQLELTIKAVATLPQVSLLLLSSGPQAPFLDALGQRLLADRYLRKSVSYSDMPKYYRAADLFTLCPWAHESYPVVYLEALACNLPVVASDDPIRQSTIGSAGLYVDPQNTSAYAATLKQALAIRWGNRPRQQAQNYSWSKIAIRYDRLFRSLVHGK